MSPSFFCFLVERASPLVRVKGIILVKRDENKSKRIEVTQAK